jgi:transcriptional regulator with AAA-type ATPase domain
MFEEIVGSSKAIRNVLTQVAKVAPSDSTVLVLGETGTGKELIARAIHRRSNRSSRAFIRVNCAAIPASLIASELFGHEKGAFTGALQRRLGRFELADGGTLFLDEIGDLPAEPRLRSCECFKKEKSNGSAAAIPSLWMCEYWPQRTAISKRLSQPAPFAKTCSIGSMCFPS